MDIASDATAGDRNNFHCPCDRTKLLQPLMLEGKIYQKVCVPEQTGITWEFFLKFENLGQ